jgi:hypothetical protein
MMIVLSKSKWLIRVISLWVAVFAFPLAVLADDSATPSEGGVKSSEKVDRLTPPAASVEVKLGAFLIDLTNINGAEQMFNADVLFRAQWKDPRLADASSQGVRKMKLDDVWHPRMRIANMRDITAYLPKVVEVSPEGVVVFRQRLMGDYTGRLDLREFPHDRQMLGVHIVAQGYTPEQVHFVLDPEFIGRDQKLTIPDWSVGDVNVRPEPYVVSRLGSVAGVKMEFEARRHVTYYLTTILASAVIIVCMAWMVFWMPLDAINPRVSISVTSMLTLIAHRFVVGSELPRLSYLTQMDYFLLGATFMVLLGLIGVVTVARVTSRGNPELGVQLNVFFRWLYPVVFVCILALFLV